MKLILSISSNCVLTIINASAAVTLLEQRPEKNSGSERHWHRRGRGFESPSEPEFFSGLCSSSVTAALALEGIHAFRRYSCTCCSLFQHSKQENVSIKKWFIYARPIRLPMISSLSQVSHNFNMNTAVQIPTSAITGWKTFSTFLHYIKLAFQKG